MQANWLKAWLAAGKRLKMKFKIQKLSSDTEKNNQQNGNVYSSAFVLFQVNGKILNLS